MGRISSTFHQGTMKIKKSPESHHKTVRISRRKRSCAILTLTIKLCHDQYDSHIVGRQGIHQNTIAKYCKINNDNRQPDNATKVKICGYQVTE